MKMRCRKNVASFMAAIMNVLLLLLNATLVSSSLSSSSSSVGHNEESVLPPTEVFGQQQLVKQNFLVGIASLGAIYENRTQCGQELELLLKAIGEHEVWGLKVLDTFGSPPKTFTWGNYFWFGTPDLCEDLNQPFTISMSRSQPRIFNATSPFPMQLTMVYLNFTTPYYIDLKLPFEDLIHLGLCLPKSCSLSKIRSYTDAYFQHNYFEMQRNFQLQLKAVDIKAPQFSWSYFAKAGSVMFIFILCTTILLGIFAEVVYKSKNNLKQQHSRHIKSQLNPAQHSAANHEVNILQQYNEHPKSSICEELLMCFRFTLNYETVISLENSNRYSTFFSVMAGMRTIVCLWITVFHVYYYSLFAISNTPFIFARLEKLILQPVLQACFYVDIFFIMSSFLLFNHFLSNLAQIEKIRQASWWGILKLYMRSILQRYMRLTPVMIITMLLSTMFLDFVNMYSPFRLGEHSGFYCKTNWWYNLLYIHNFLDMNKICCSWTWYLACEMQYFVLFTALLILHVKKPNIGKIVFVTLAVGFVAIGWMCNYGNDITFEIDVVYSTLNQLYVKPWVRIPPYLGGAVMGWLMHRLQCQQQQQHQQQQEEQQVGVITDPHQHQQQHQQHHHPHQRQPENVRLFGRKAFWLLCFVIYVVTNFMSYWRSTPSWVVATIMSMGKLLFALCIGGVIIMCACGRGGCLNRLLSARPFLFLNKFCFSIYMLAPVVVVAMFGLRNEPTNFTEVGSGADFLAIVVLSIMGAFVMLMLIELPLQRITKLLLRKQGI